MYINMNELNFEAIAKINNNTAIAISSDMNALFEVNMENGSCDFIDIIPNEDLLASRLYTKAVFINNKVFFSPALANHIAVYNVTTKEIKIIEFKIISTNNLTSKHKFNGAVVYGKYVYLIPCTYPGVIRINSDDDSIEYFDSWVNNDNFTFRKSPMIDGDFFYATSVINNVVLKFNMKTCIGKIYHVGNNNNGCWSTCKVKNDFWLAPCANGPIIKWNLSTDTFVEYNNYPKGFIANDFLFTKIYFSNNVLNLIPAHSNMWISLNPENGIMEKNKDIELEECSVTLIMFEMDNYIYIQRKNASSCQFIRLNISNNTYIPFEFIFCNGKEKYMELLKNNIKNEKSIIKEKDVFGLEQFIQALL